MMKPILMLAALTCATPAMADCRAALASVETLPIVQYDPFNSGVATADIVVDLTVADDLADCRLGLSISGLMPGSVRQATLGYTPIRYRLFVDGQEQPNNPDALRELRVGQLEAKRVTVRIEVPAGQIGLAGLYVDPITIRLADLNGGEVQLGPERQAAVNIAMESRAQINLAGSDIGTGSFGFARLDFGALTLRARRSARVQVRSTASVAVRLASENGGALTRINGHGEKLNYRLTFDGSAMGLASGPASLLRDPSPSVAGSSYDLEVEIEDDPQTVPAGDYRDVIVIDVDPV